ncbi:MAG TPA: hypothetical protein DC048_10700, partial [Planctomycetaceae bacterium]|nr:hypothetical protein [Planctomycetaceae bacterium]
MQGGAGGNMPMQSRSDRARGALPRRSVRHGVTALTAAWLAWSVGGVLAGSPSVVAAEGDAAEVLTTESGASVLTATPPIAGPFDGPALDDEACMQVLRRCCCCPGWDHYAIFDVLFLQRNNQAGNQPL